MPRIQALDPDAICHLVGFAAGAEVIGLLGADRKLRAVLKGPVARRHFRALSVKRWGEACRCHYRASMGDRGASLASTPSSTNDTASGDESRASDSEEDWSEFYLTRIGHRAPSPSPLGLIQERHAGDAYHLLACCILCSRTSGGKVVSDSVRAFFEACPTPSSVLSADIAELRTILLPLGLNRELVMRRFAEGFVRTAWADPSELHGCGVFASDSWRIFCLGQMRPTKCSVRTSSKSGADASSKRKSAQSKRAPLDRNLAAYCRFVEQQRRGDAAGYDNGASGPQGARNCASSVSAQAEGRSKAGKVRPVKTRDSVEECAKRHLRTSRRRSGRRSSPGVPQQSTFVPDEMTRGHKRVLSTHGGGGSDEATTTLPLGEDVNRTTSKVPRIRKPPGASAIRSTKKPRVGTRRSPRYA